MAQYYDDRAIGGGDDDVRSKLQQQTSMDDIARSVIKDPELQKQMTKAFEQIMSEVISKTRAEGADNKFVFFQIHDPSAPASLPRGWGPIRDKALARMILAKEVIPASEMKSVFVMHPYERDASGKIVKNLDDNPEVDQDKTFFGVPDSVVSRYKANQDKFDANMSITDAMGVLQMKLGKELDLKGIAQCVNAAAKAKAEGGDVKKACEAASYDGGKKCVFENEACIAKALVEVVDKNNEADKSKSDASLKKVTGEFRRAYDYVERQEQRRRNRRQRV